MTIREQLSKLIESGCALGHYTCEFTMDGEVYDDYFVIDQPSTVFGEDHA